MAVSSYNTNPDQNTTISGINIAEGCPPSGINNAIRQLMADIRTDSNTQNTNITNAKSAADDAQSAAEAAQSTANTAKTTANTAKTTASAALPKAGGTMTGAINMNSKNITGINHLVFSNNAELWVG